MKLVFTDEAKFDLDDIGDRIADHNPVRAVAFVDELVARCAKLTGAPYAYPLVPRHGNSEISGIRRVVYGHYLIFYRITTDAVEIVRVLHGARDFESILPRNEKDEVSARLKVTRREPKNGGPAVADPPS
jgi:toxin ParE1/3/4